MAKTISIKVLRSFLYQGKPSTAGDVLEVPANVAGELIANNKAVRADFVDAKQERQAYADSVKAADEPVDATKPRRGRPPKEKE